MYPVSLNISGKLCVIIGGGRVAARKVSGLLAAQAKIRIISPKLIPELKLLAADNRLEWLERAYRTGDLAGALLVYAATDSPEVQQQVVLEAEQNGQLVNVIDTPGRCSFQVPAVVRRGDLVLTVSTNGTSPAVSARIRHELESCFGQEYAYLLRLMAHLREHILASDLDCSERKMIFKKILHKDIVHWIAEEQWDLLRNHLRAVLGKNLDVDIRQLGRDT